MTPGESVVSPNQLYVTAGYLEALRVPLVRGRLFTDSDAPPAPPVVIIDASQLYGVGPLDSGVMLLVMSVLAIASLIACAGPARRAARVDPVIALQS